MRQDRLAAHVDSIYSLAELVEAANGLLPTYLPKEASGRAAEDVTPRLVRFYTTEGLLPEAHREGREARYSYEHLLSLLAVRRLLADGFGSAAIRRALEGRSPAELEALLREEVQVQLVPRPSGALADPAKADFLRTVRERAGLAAPKVLASRFMAAPPVQGPKPAPLTATAWTRVVIEDGLELLVRDDYEAPITDRGDRELLEVMKAVLLQVEQNRKKRK